MICLQVQQGFDHLADGATLIKCGKHDGQAPLACRSFLFRNRPLAFLSAPIAAASQVQWAATEAYGLFQTKRDEAA